MLGLGITWRMLTLSMIRVHCRLRCWSASTGSWAAPTDPTACRSASGARSTRRWCRSSTRCRTKRRTSATSSWGSPLGSPPGSPPGSLPGSPPLILLATRSRICLPNVSPAPSTALQRRPALPSPPPLCLFPQMILGSSALDLIRHRRFCDFLRWISIRKSSQLLSIFLFFFLSFFLSSVLPVDPEPGSFFSPFPPPSLLPSNPPNFLISLEI